MPDTLLDTAQRVAAALPLVRCAWCVVGFLKLFPNHARARQSEWGWIQLAIAPEAYVLAAAALVLGSRDASASGTGEASALACALLGAALSLAGLAVSVWTFATFPAIGTGHYIASGQTVISVGPYAFVRHPTYLGVLLLWFGLGLAFRDGAVLALSAGFCALYARYARREERMMQAAFGPDYAAYHRAVGGFLPRSLRPFRARA